LTANFVFKNLNNELKNHLKQQTCRFLQKNWILRHIIYTQSCKNRWAPISDYLYLINSIS